MLYYSLFHYLKFLGSSAKCVWSADLTDDGDSSPCCTTFDCWKSVYGGINSLNSFVVAPIWFLLLFLELLLLRSLSFSFLPFFVKNLFSSSAPCLELSIFSNTFWYPWSDLLSSRFSGLTLFVFLPSTTHFLSISLYLALLFFSDPIAS